METKDDLPTSIIVVLVVLAVVISVLGTFTVVNELKNLNLGEEEAPLHNNGVQSAKISFKVADPNEGLSSATGKITFRIQEGE